MLLTLDSRSMDRVDDVPVASVELWEKNGNAWQRTPSKRRRTFTSVWFCDQKTKTEGISEIFIMYSFDWIKGILNLSFHIITLSNFCSLLRLANPPQKREEPRTRRRFERIDPKREYFNTEIFPWWSAKIAIMSSVAFPHVAFRRPPTANQIPWTC